MIRKLSLAALALACVASPALADVATGSVVVLPYGDLFVEALKAAEQVVIPLAVTGVSMLVGRIFPVARLFLTDRVVEAALRKWLDYGINAVPHAGKGGELSIDVGSAVLATALQRGVDRAKVSKLGEQLLKLAGGPDEAANKLFRMLDLEPKAGVGVLESVLSDLRAQS